MPDYNISILTEKLVIEDPVFSLKDKYFLTREEAFERAMEKSIHCVRLSKKLQLDGIERQILNT